MTTKDLMPLIREAMLLGNHDLCKSTGHAWESEGGRGCPNCPLDNASQPVYKCARCGIYDYGEKGGPGDADCITYCELRAGKTRADVARERAAEEAEEAAERERVFAACEHRWSGYVCQDCGAVAPFGLTVPEEDA